MAKKQTHIHKYHKIYPNYAIGPLGVVRGVWACALPTCNHFMPHNVADNVPGKASICWNCDSEFILDEENMVDDEPICGECTQHKRGITMPSAEELERINTRITVANKLGIPSDQVTDRQIENYLLLERIKD